MKASVEEASDAVASKLIATPTQKPSICRVVVYRTQHPEAQCNGTKDHPAVVTRVWGDTCVNLKVLPDCGPIYDVTSRMLIDPDDQQADGWFWPPRA